MTLIHRVLLLIHWIEQRGWRWVLTRLRNEFISPSSKPLRFLKKILLKTRAAVLMFIPSILKGSNQTVINPFTLYFIFDLQLCPIAFDIASYLAGAEIERRRRGLKRIFILIVPAVGGGMRQELPEYDAVVDADSRLWRVNHLLVPCFSLLPSCGGYAICFSRDEARAIAEAEGANIFPSDWMDALPSRPQRRWVFESARLGESVFPLLTAPLSALRYVDQYLLGVADGRRVVVITLRQYRYTPSRNSNLAAWLEFAQSLDAQRYAVVFVLDTEEAMSPVSSEFQSFLVFQPGSWSVPLRMALYQRAFLNLAIAQGPMELCWFNETCRYLMFLPLNSAPLTSEGPMRSEGFDIGMDLIFAKPWQHWVWEKDDLDIITNEFLRFVPILEEHNVNH